KKPAQYGEGGLPALEPVGKRLNHGLYARCQQPGDEHILVRDTIPRRTAPKGEALLLHLDQTLEDLRCGETHAPGAVGNRSDLNLPGSRGFLQETSEGTTDIAEPQQCYGEEGPPDCRLWIADCGLTEGVPWGGSERGVYTRNCQRDNP